MRRFRLHFGLWSGRGRTLRNRISIARTCDIGNSSPSKIWAYSRLISCEARIFSRTLSGLKAATGMQRRCSGAGAAVG
jgi:hypothetical protein